MTANACSGIMDERCYIC